MISPIRDIMRAMDPEVPMDDARPMDTYVARSLAPARFNTILIGLFASVALLLTALGLYGVISYSVSRRTQEIGTRMAISAHPANILKLVVAQGMLLTVVGLLAGLAGATLISRLLVSLLFGVSPTDFATYTVMSVVLCSVSALASYIPARRAARIDPMAALRYE